ncbi:hypothetical protein DV701_05375 [Ornithinimicrobium avium]|uniref:Uncharacterized protein n=1 Tax=Ornithinimicrobium avium TaxID=2283195 RepID=A0A345NKR5_9MICO|nr:hypothetical protein DV701_05375 [Ornithinimicrobium avium]
MGQLLERGWTLTLLRRSRSGRWQEPMPRVVVPHRGPVDAPTRLVAMALWAGRKSILTGAVALAELGLQPRQTRMTTFVVPDGSRAKQYGLVQVVRSSRTPDLAIRRGPVGVARAARAVADAAVYERHAAPDLEHLTISVLQRGLATAEELERELWQRPRARVGPVWKGLGAFVQGAWSRPEGVLREVVEGAGGFPPLITNCRLETLDGGRGAQPARVVGLPDGYFEDAGVAIQVHSRQYHQGHDDRGSDRWAETVEKDGAFVEQGVTVVAVTPWTLYRAPGRFVKRLRTVVERQLASPGPSVRVVRLDEKNRRAEMP